MLFNVAIVEILPMPMLPISNWELELKLDIFTLATFSFLLYFALKNAGGFSRFGVSILPLPEYHNEAFELLHAVAEHRSEERIANETDGGNAVRGEREGEG